jgi:hypothetical protein
MPGGGGSPTLLAMEIHVVVTSCPPPAGELVVDDGPPVPFVGWLALLGELDRLASLAFPTDGDGTDG